MPISPDRRAVAGAPPTPGPELVIGLVGSAGLDLDGVASHMARALREVAYTTDTIVLSRLLHRIEWSTPLGDPPTEDRATYITTHQDRGDELREKTGRGDILALLAIAQVRALRGRAPMGHDSAAAVDAQASIEALESVDPYRGLRQPRSRHAYILRSLKHPDEARTLRDVYGERFILVAAYADDERTLDDLAAEIAHSKAHAPTAEDREEARKIISRDQADPENDFGQNVRATYPLADCFLDVNREDVLHTESSRFVELLFASPYQTPRRDEFGMFVAHASSLRSAALGRQVGSAILDNAGAVVAVGTNEVPKAGGGQYWVDDPHDYRDFQYEDGSDSSDTMRRAMIQELLERYEKFGIAPPTRVSTNQTLSVDELVPLLKGTRMSNLVEFGRNVHAEMAAISDAARRGVAVADCTLYTTTFPCHNCARHLIAVGIKEVVYVEPYAKSLAVNLHKDSISIAGFAPGVNRVRFRQFTGVAPKRYAQLFTMVERKDILGYRLYFRPEHSLPRDVDLQAFYQHREARAIAQAGRVLGESGFTVIDDLLSRARYD